jgi:alpha-tubulin suppressor-like RCC1 family protein
MLSLFNYYTLFFAAISVALAQPATVVSVNAGSGHTMYVKSDNTLWAMGSNDYGPLGDGTTTSRSTPAQVTTGVASVAVGWNTTMYVKTDGSLWGMGHNLYGKLGDGNQAKGVWPFFVICT